MLTYNPARPKSSGHRLSVGGPQWRSVTAAVRRAEDGGAASASGGGAQPEPDGGEGGWFEMVSGERGRCQPKAFFGAIFIY